MKTTYLYHNSYDKQELFDYITHCYFSDILNNYDNIDFPIQSVLNTQMVIDLLDEMCEANTIHNFQNLDNNIYDIIMRNIPDYIVVNDIMFIDKTSELVTKSTNDLDLLPEIILLVERLHD